MKNKTSIAKETVYDRCAYVGCYNGKFINGRRLFHFPAETDRRLEMWIERSGNFRLRTWAATSLRKAGLCGDHFEDKSFTNPTRKALRRNVVPRHYTEDLKYRKTCRDKRACNENNRNTTKNENSDDAPINFDVSSCNLLEFSTVNENCEEKVHESLSPQSDEYGFVTKIKKVPKTRSPSPVVEYIVEELDENLIRQESQLSTRESVRKDEENNEVDNADAEELSTDRSCLRFEEPTLNSQTSDRADDRVSSPTHEELNYSKVELLWQDDPGVPSGGEDGTVRVETRSDDAERPLSDAENALQSLCNENKRLRKMMRLLKQNLRCSRAQEARARDRLTSIDEFLTAQECTNPAARAMVKLALRKPKTLCTKEERDFAIHLYRNSISAFVALRRYGCNFPGKRMVERWIAEESGDQTSDFDCTSETQVDRDEVNDAVESGVEINDEIAYVPETIDHCNGVAGEFHVPGDDLGEQFQVHMDDLDVHEEEHIHEEFIETLSADADGEDTLK